MTQQKRTYRLKFHRGDSGWRDWYWRIVAPNGKIVAIAGEGYMTRANAQRSAERLLRVFADGKVVIEGVDVA